MARLTVTAGSGRTARVPSPPTSSSQPPGTTFNLLPGPPTSSHHPKLVSPDHPNTHTHHPPTIRAVLWLVAMSRFSLRTGPGMGLQAGWPGSVGEMARVPGPPWCLCRVLTHPPRHPLHPPPHRPLCMPRYWAPLSQALSRVAPLCRRSCPLPVTCTCTLPSGSPTVLRFRLCDS